MSDNPTIRLAISAALRPGHDTGPNIPWQLKHCPECGCAASFAAQTVQGTFCCVCYLDKQRAGGVNTLPVIPQDTDAEFCSCTKCRIRRINNMLSLEGMQPASTPVPAPAPVEAVPNPSPARLNDVRIMPGISPSMPPPLIHAIANKFTAQLRSVGSVVLNTLADQIQKSPVEHLRRVLTPSEVSALVSAGLVGPETPPEGAEELSQLPTQPHPLPGVRDGRSLDPASKEFIRKMAEQGVGVLFVEQRADAADYVADFYRQVMVPFSKLAQRIPLEDANEVANFMASCLCGVTYASFESIMRTLYYTVHTGDAQSPSLVEETEDMAPDDATDEPGSEPKPQPKPKPDCDDPYDS